MNLVNTADLRPGQIFSEHVYTIGNNLLVPALVPLRQKDIDLLLSLDIKTVSTEGNVIDAQEKFSELEDVIDSVHINSIQLDSAQFDSIGFDSTQFDSDGFNSAQFDSDGYDSVKADPANTGSTRFNSANTDSPQKIEAVKFSISDVRQNTGPYRTYKSLIDKLDSAFIQFKTGDNLEMRIIDNICLQLLQDLREHPDSFVGFILGGEISSKELAKSSVNTAILSALTAQELKLPNHKIHNIVSGALLHDIGMLRVSKGITEKKGGLSEAELEQIKSHPLHTSKIITKELYGPREVNLTALQHHERWDGKCYPDKLAGSAIDIGARIVSVSDAFEAMVSKKSYRNSLVGYQAIKNLLADNGSRFDPSVIIAFTKIIGIYPINSIVRLNNGSVARVIKVNTIAPMRPIIQLLVDKNGKFSDSRSPVTIDLLADKTIFIKEAVDKKEIINQYA